MNELSEKSKKILRDALFQLVANANTPENMRGLHHSHGFLVAGGPWMLARVRMDYPETFEGVTLDKSLKPIEGFVYEPRWHYPFDAATNCATGESLEHSEVINACQFVDASPDKDGERNAVRLNGVNVYPPRLLLAMNVFTAVQQIPYVGKMMSGEVPVLILRSENVQILIAGIYYLLGGETTDLKIYAYEKLKELGDLL